MTPVLQVKKQVIPDSAGGDGFGAGLKSDPCSVFLKYFCQFQSFRCIIKFI
jgi:hypothetical protein